MMGGAGSSIRNYQLGQAYFSNTDSTVKVNVSPATNIIDGQKYTVFQFPKQDGVLNESAEKYIEVLKTTRHPYILKYLALFSDSSHDTLVTEHVIPLDVAVEKQEKEEICAGLYNILEALLFLHERSFICHNAVSVSSIFVSDNGEWKLASFENSSKVLRLSKQSFDTDLTGFAEFALSVLEYLKDDSESTRMFMERLEEELSADNKEVCTLRLLLDDPFFKFPYLELLRGIQNLTLKSNAEKIALFSVLPDMLRELSPYVACRQFVPLLFSHMVLTDPVANELLMPHLFSSGNDYCVENDMPSLFDQDHFIKYSLPLILSLYESRDLTVRLTLMKYLPMYVDCIDNEILQNEVLPELLIGLKDSNDKVVQETLLALASIVKVIGGNVVVGGESAPYFHDRKPDFSRSEKSKGQGLSPSATVMDILKSKPTPSKVDKKVAEERKQKRIEREKQREEQRKKREERRKERDLAKMKKDEQKFLNQETGDYKENIILVSTDTSENSIQIIAEPYGECNNFDENEDEDNSAAEWEGFEVESNSSDQEQETKDLVSPVTGYKSGESSDNNVVLTNENTKNPFNSKKVLLPDSQEELPFKENVSEIMEFINSKIVPSMNKSQNTNDSSRHDNHRTSEQVNQSTNKIKSTNPIEGKKSANKIKEKSTDKMEPIKTTKKGMNLSNNKKNVRKSEDLVDSENKEDKIDKKVDLKNSSKEITTEFDIKIGKNKFTMEPDYFADMVPSFEKKSSSTVYIEKDVSISNKFNMDLSVVESGGWDDDDWGNEEEVF